MYQMSNTLMPDSYFPDRDDIEFIQRMLSVLPINARNKARMKYPRGMHNTPQEITPVVSNFIRHKQIQWAKMCQKRDAAAKAAAQTEVKHTPENRADSVRRLLAAKPTQQGSLL